MEASSQTEPRESSSMAEQSWITAAAGNATDNAEHGGESPAPAEASRPTTVGLDTHYCYVARCSVERGVDACVVIFICSGRRPQTPQKKNSFFVRRNTKASCK